MDIYLIRHGESISNVSGTYCGITDVPLTDMGKKQSDNVIRFMKNKHIERIYTSPLSRCMYISRAICEAKGIDLISDNRIIERSFGVWEYLTYKQICDDYPTESKKWNDDWINYKIPNGESCMDVEMRCREFLDEIIKRNESCAVVTHSGVVRSMVCDILGMSTENLWHLKVNNGSVTHIEVTDGYAVLCGFNYIT